MDRREALYLIGLPSDAPPALVGAALRTYARELKGRRMRAAAPELRRRIDETRRRLARIREALLGYDWAAAGANSERMTSSR